MNEDYRRKFSEALVRIKAARGDRPRIARRLPDTLKISGHKRTQLLELVNAGLFPRPFSLSTGGRAIAWDDDELAAHREVMMGDREQEVIDPSKPFSPSPKRRAKRARRSA